jgi:hypothetical protein
MMRWRVAIAACMGAIACERAAPRGPDTALPAVLRLEPYFRDLRVLKVVAGRDTLRLLLDTGGGATLITPTVATQLGCTPYGADVGHRMTGERVVFARCDSLALRAGAWAAVIRPVAVFDVNALLPRELPRLDGVLALDAFRGRSITLDWAGDSVTVWGASAGPPSSLAPLPTRWATGEAGRFLSALIGFAGTRDTVWLLLDSGNLRGTLLSTNLLRDSLLLLGSPREAILRMPGDSSLTLPYASADLVVDGALGTDFLRRGPVTLDLRAAGRPVP